MGGGGGLSVFLRLSHPWVLCRHCYRVGIPHILLLYTHVVVVIIIVCFFFPKHTGYFLYFIFVYKILYKTYNKYNNNINCVGCPGGEEQKK